MNSQSNRQTGERITPTANAIAECLIKGIAKEEKRMG